MRYEDAVKIEELAAAAHDARQAFDAAGMQNTANLTPEQARELTVRYELLKAENARAQGLLAQAQGQMYAYGKLRS